MSALRSLDTSSRDEQQPATEEPALCALLQTLHVDRATVALSPVGLDVTLAHLVSLDAARAAGTRRPGRGGRQPPPSGRRREDRPRPSSVTGVPAAAYR